MSPSGHHGCVKCGAPTDCMVRLRVEHFRDGDQTRRQIEHTWSMSFCEDCGVEAYVNAAEAMHPERAAERFKDQETRPPQRSRWETST